MITYDPNDMLRIMCAEALPGQLPPSIELRCRTQPAPRRAARSGEIICAADAVAAAAAVAVRRAAPRRRRRHRRRHTRYCYHTSLPPRETSLLPLSR